MRGRRGGEGGSEGKNEEGEEIRVGEKGKREEIMGKSRGKKSKGKE